MPWVDDGNGGSKWVDDGEGGKAPDPTDPQTWTVDQRVAALGAAGYKWVSGTGPSALWRPPEGGTPVPEVSALQRTLVAGSKPPQNRTNASASNIPGFIFVDDGNGGGKYVHQDGSDVTQAEIDAALTPRAGAGPTGAPDAQYDAAGNYYEYRNGAWVADPQFNNPAKAAGFKAAGAGAPDSRYLPDGTFQQWLNGVWTTDPTGYDPTKGAGGKSTAAGQAELDRQAAAAAAAAAAANTGGQNEADRKAAADRQAAGIAADAAAAAAAAGNTATQNQADRDAAAARETAAAAARAAEGERQRQADAAAQLLNLQQQQAQLNEQIRANRESEAQANANLAFLKDKLGVETREGQADRALRTQDSIWGAERDIQQINVKYAEMQQQNAQFNSQQQIVVANENQRRVEAQQARQEKLATDIGLTAQDAGSRGKLAAKLLANPGLGELDSGLATGEDWFTKESLAPLTDLLSQRADAAKSPNFLSYTPVASIATPTIPVPRFGPQAGAAAPGSPAAPTSTPGAAPAQVDPRVAALAAVGKTPAEIAALIAQADAPALTPAEFAAKVAAAKAASGATAPPGGGGGPGGGSSAPGTPGAPPPGSAGAAALAALAALGAGGGGAAVSPANTVQSGLGFGGTKYDPAAGASEAEREFAANNASRASIGLPPISRQDAGFPAYATGGLAMDGAYMGDEQGAELHIPLGPGEALVIPHNQVKNFLRNVSPGAMPAAAGQMKSKQKGKGKKGAPAAAKMMGMAGGGVFDSGNIFGTNDAALGDQSGTLSFLAAALKRALSGTPWQQQGRAPTPVEVSAPGTDQMVQELGASLSALGTGTPTDFFLRRARALAPVGIPESAGGVRRSA